ncbi:MAG: HD domain-containing protein [Deltaproteobacteria bacterium]|nr:HD domain-containing protein [Deltaproteobacteria bacterium]
MNSEPAFLERLYDRIFQLALPSLQTRENESHTKIAHAFAERLLSREGGDRSIVVPAILLHDVGWSRVPEHLQLLAFGPHMSRPELRDVHEREGAEMARAILAEVGYPAEKVELIARIVSRHDSRQDADCLEEAIVKDADKLYRFSPGGFSVWAMRFGLPEAEYLSRLERWIGRWFLTATGRRIARTEALARRREIGTKADGSKDSSLVCTGR